MVGDTVVGACVVGVEVVGKPVVGKDVNGDEEGMLDGVWVGMDVVGLMLKVMKLV